MHQAAYCHRSEGNKTIPSVSGSPGKGWLALVSWLNASERDLQLALRKAFGKERETFQTAGNVKVSWKAYGTVVLLRM